MLISTFTNTLFKSC